MPEQLLKDMEGNNVVGTLFEECFHLVDFAEAESNPLRMTLGEVRAVQKRKEEYAGKATQLCMGMNAHANLSAGAEAIEPILKEMSKYTVMRGIRESCAGLDVNVPELFSPGENLPGGPMACYDQPAFRSGYALLQKYNLSFDAWCYHKQIPMVTRLARDFPDIPICLCHLGSPVFLEGLTNKPVQPYASVLAEWKSYIDEAAKCPNMVCKSDALPMAFGPHDWYNRPTPPTAAEVVQRLAPFYMYTSECATARLGAVTVADSDGRPLLRTVAKFGVDRVMFSSNFPMDRSGCSYTCLWNAYKIMTKDLPLAARKKLFRDNAMRFYRLDHNGVVL